MFRHDRVYRAIVFAAPSFKSTSGVMRLFPSGAFSEEEPLLKSDALTVCHHYYYSRTQFTRNIDLLEKARVPAAKSDLYRYNAYLIRISDGPSPKFVLAVPFWRMAKEVFTSFRQASAGKGVNYMRVSLGDVLPTAAKSAPFAALIKITKVAYVLEGDGDCDSIEFGGKDLVRYKTMEAVRRFPKGPSILPQALRLSYNKSFTERFTLETDKFGHYRFRVGHTNQSFFCLSELFKFLSQAGLIIPEQALPYMGGEESQDELSAE
jgi:hypothetical protein